MVTGAAQGLGLGITEQLAREGAAVVIGDVQLEKAQAVADQLAEKGLTVQAAYLDVTDSAGWTSWSTVPVSRRR